MRQQRCELQPAKEASRWAIVHVLCSGLQLGAEIYTADRAWSGLDVGCDIHLIR